MADGRPASEAGLRPTAELVREAYLQGVADFDVLLEELLRGLRADEERWGRTAVIVTSDHGESLYERGWGNHGGSLHGDETAIPLAARLPGVEPESRRVECLVGLVDLMPTACDYLGVECPGDVQGWSFLAGPGGPDRRERRYLAIEGVMRAARHRAVQNRRFKLHFEPNYRPGSDAGPGPYSLFDLAEDREERWDRLAPARRGSGSDRAFEALSAALPDAVATLPRRAPKTREIEPDVLERLEALGYGGVEGRTQ